MGFDQACRRIVYIGFGGRFEHLCNCHQRVSRKVYSDSYHNQLGREYSRRLI